MKFHELAYQQNCQSNSERIDLVSANGLRSNIECLQRRRDRIRGGQPDPPAVLGKTLLSGHAQICTTVRSDCVHTSRFPTVFGLASSHCVCEANAEI